MIDILGALARAFGSLLHTRMIMLMIWPMALAILFWTIVAVLYGSVTVAWMQGYLNDSFVAQWTEQWFNFAPVAAFLGWFALFVLFVPLVLITASLIVGIFGVTAMVNHVAAQDYPELERKHGGSIPAMAANAFFALFVFLVLSALTLPFWFIPFLWPVIPVLLFAYFNQRMFRFDALAEHASDEEMRRIFSLHGGSMFMLAVILSMIAHVPIIGFFTPVLAGLAFIHFCLARLRELRRAA